MVFLEVEIDEDSEEVSELESLVLVLDDSDDENGEADDHSAQGHQPAGRTGHFAHCVLQLKIELMNVLKSRVEM